MPKLPHLPKFPGYSGAERPKEFTVCDVCGQRINTDDMDQVFHHGPAPHDPLEIVSPEDDG